MGCQTRQGELLFPQRKRTSLTEEMEHVFVNEEKRDLECGILPSGEGNLPGTHSETLGNWVEQPNLEQEVRTRRIRAGVHTKGSTTVKCEKGTPFVHSH